MIKRFNLDSYPNGAHIEWPENPKKPASELFGRRTPLRKLIVLIDSELLFDPPPSPYTDPTFDRRGLLSGLLTHPLIRTFRFSLEGPDPGAEVVEKSWGAKAYPGWAVLDGAIDGDGPWTVTYQQEDNNLILAGIIGNATIVAANHQSSTAYSAHPPEQARRLRVRDMLAAQVADQGVGADIYVTERPYLHSFTRSPARGVTICHPEEALPLVSLYLRTQGEFVLARPHPDAVTSSKSSFFWIGAWELLPEAWRWVTACARHAAGASDESILTLARSLIWRVDRALIARDEVHVALNQAQDRDQQEDVLNSLDSVLALLMGAVDVTARVAHYVFGLPDGQSYRAAWQSKRWCKGVFEEAPTLADIVGGDSQGKHTLTVLRLLKNSIHGTALQGVSTLGTGPDSSHQMTLIGLPPLDEESLLSAMDALGGAATWGLQPLLPLESHLDPGMLVDQLVVHVVELLNGLMRETPMESLEHVDLLPADRLPPPEQKLFEVWIRKSVRWQLGF